MPEQPTFGQRAAERMAHWIGSWRFLIVQSLLLALWLAANVLALIHHWDPYPFILLNLMLSFQAAYTGPVLLIAANRGEQRDRQLLEKAEQIVEAIDRHLAENTRLTAEIHAVVVTVQETP